MAEPVTMIDDTLWLQVGTIEGAQKCIYCEELQIAKSITCAGARALVNLSL